MKNDNVPLFYVSADIDTLRGLVEMIAPGGVWVSSEGMQLRVYEKRKLQDLPFNPRGYSWKELRKIKREDITPKTRASWAVTQNARFAGIESYHNPITGKALIKCFDGYQPYEHRTDLPGIGKPLDEFWQHLQIFLLEQCKGKVETNNSKGPVGHPGLTRDELIYRLAKAQEGEEIKANDRNVTWKEIRKEIEFPYSVKLLEDARHRLHRYQKSDPENLLAEVKIFRKERKKT